MLTLLKNATLFDPDCKGKSDILLAGERIVQVAPAIHIAATGCPVDVLDLEGMIVTPGLIDQHVHLLGGGGEGGPCTMTPEACLSEITSAGVTTVIGCLGTDGVTRHVDSLLVKARALEAEGISTYIYTGAYQVPPPTITGSVRSDLMLIDKVIGVGEVAISDHRSSQPTREELARLAAEARVGGMLAGKAGKVHLHVGGGERGLGMIMEIVQKTEIPVEQFNPTHINRNRRVLEWGIEFGRMGGFVDVTAADPTGTAPGDLTPGEAVKILLSSEVPANRITMSSDGNGSAPLFNSRGETVEMGIGAVSALSYSLKTLIHQYGLAPEEAFRMVTANVADCHRLPRKGYIRAQFDADLTVFNAAFEVVAVIARGRHVVRDGKPVAFGMFEKLAVGEKKPFVRAAG